MAVNIAVSDVADVADVECYCLRTCRIACGMWASHIARWQLPLAPKPTALGEKGLHVVAVTGLLQ